MNNSVVISIALLILMLIVNTSYSEPISGPVKLKYNFKIIIKNGDANQPYVEYNDTDNVWEFSDDGTSIKSFGDMFKVVYDTDEDDIMDVGESLNDGVSNPSISSINSAYSNVHSPSTIGTKTIDESGLSDGDVLKYDSNSGNWECETSVAEISALSYSIISKTADYTVTTSDCQGLNILTNPTAINPITFSLPDAVAGYEISFCNLRNSYDIWIKAYTGNKIENLDQFLLNGKDSFVRLTCHVNDTWVVSAKHIDVNAYYVGGQSAGTTFLNNMGQYTVLDRQWEHLGNTLPTSLGAGSAFVLNGYAYYVGGFNYNSGYVYHLNTYRFDPATKSWTQLGTGSDLPDERAYASTFVINGKAYLVGGYDGSTVYGDTFEFDPDAGTSGEWTELTHTDSDLPAVRMAGGVFIINGDAYYVGGTGDATNSTGELYKFNATARTWAAVSGGSLPVGHRWGSTFIFNGKAYWVGGYSGTSTYSNKVYEFDPDAGTAGEWSEINNMLYALVGHKCFTLDNSVYLSGGKNSTAQYYSNSYRFDGDTKTWSYLWNTTIYSNRNNFSMFIIKK